MKGKSQMVESDGFDKSVAEKMPKIRRLEEPPPSVLDDEPEPLKGDPPEISHEMGLPKEGVEDEAVLRPKGGMDTEPNLDVLRLVEDLHTQLLASGRAKRALEMDLSSHRKTIYQLAQDNKDLRRQLDELGKELRRSKEVQSESIYLQEENADALEKIQGLQQELRAMSEGLDQTIQERDEAIGRIHDLESQMEQNDLLRIKGRMKEREASHLSEENQELRSKLEEVLVQNTEMERRYEALRKSFNEVRESLTLLRDSCKSNYYNLSEVPEREQ
jgi:chromosome segregation ATPase